MKAKEYVERFKKEGSTAKAAFNVAFDMLAEVKTIGETRRVRSNEGFFAILNEMSEKWKAFVRLAGPLSDGSAIKLDGFEGTVQRLMPEIWQEWMLAPRT